MEKKVLVTGATGFIGKYAIRKLLDSGYEVVAIVRKKSTDLGRDVSVIEADISDEKMMQNVATRVKQCDIVIHMAANLDMKGHDETISVNCIGTYHLIRLAELLLAEKFIYISSIPVIGVPRVLPITEEHPVEPKTLYHISKYMGEQMVQALCPSAMQKIILRIPSPIGVGMNEKNYLSFLLKRCRKNELIEVYGQGMRRQNYIDVRDIASAILHAVQGREQGLFLIGGKQDITNRELAFLCKEVTESQSEIIWGRREDPEEENQWIISIQKAQSQLNFVPEYDIKDTLYWICDTMGKSE